MFGGLNQLLQSSTVGPPPTDVPPATPIQLPEFNPGVPKGTLQHDSLVRFLQSLHRPVELRAAHFEALGIQLHAEAPAEDVVPDASFLPPLSKEWENLSSDQASAKDTGFRLDLSNGNKSPEARVYAERRNELLTDNQLAFRTIRRMRPEPGAKTPRLGHCYDFFTRLEAMASYWDDTSLPTIAHQDEQSDLGDKKTSSQSPPSLFDAGLKQAHLAMAGSEPLPVAALESDSRSESKGVEEKSSWRVTYRTAAGSAMPPELRHGVISAFIKLVSYDFGCNITAPRAEPRLHLLEPSPTHEPCSQKRPSQEPVNSYFNSGCVFLARVPTKREAARAGIVEGPLAAVSARNTTSFSTPTENNVDFGREIVAALITAQHRAREGKEERRIGEGKWWATARRWGGAEGGPIGREIEGNGEDSDKVKSPVATDLATAATESSISTGKEANSNPSSTKQNSSSSSTRPQSPTKPISPASGLPMREAPTAKKQRKGRHLSIYDNYRQVRLPSSTWNKKTHYSAIGKTPGADYDDVFVISSLFHHVSILRVRVPLKLLDVFAGAPEDNPSQRSWDKLEVWRSKWFDLFLAEERLEALRLLWGVNAWAMRVMPETSEATKNRQ